MVMHLYALFHVCIFTRWRLYVSSWGVLLAWTAMIFPIFLNSGIRQKDVAASFPPSDFSIGDRVYLRTHGRIS
jgi:hypothetical protein